MSPDLDSRVHAIDDATRTAEAALRPQLKDDGWTFVTPTPALAGNARVSLRAAPSATAAQVSEALPGEALELLWDGPAGWQRARTVHDGYLGWVQRDAVRTGQPGELRITALRAHAYAGPKVSQPVVAELCLGSRVAPADGEIVEEQGRRWVPVRLPDGTGAWVQEVVLAPLGTVDAAALALRFLDTPYVWGGRSAWGLDCSGLTQVVVAQCGHALPRDADQQHAALRAVESPRRGDLAFFPGHVGLMLDASRMIHANATHMRVTVETLGEGDYGRRLAASLEGYGRWTS